MAVCFVCAVKIRNRDEAAAEDDRIVENKLVFVKHFILSGLNHRYILLVFG